MSNRFVSDINRLVNTKNISHKTLEQIKPQPIAAIRSIGQAPSEPSSSNAGSGIASPLTEIPGTREYYDSEYVSSDGLFVVEMKPVKSAQFKDANGTVITINYAQQ